MKRDGVSEGGIEQNEARGRGGVARMEEKGVQDNWGREGRELYRLEWRELGIVQNGGGCGLSPRPGNGNISGEVTRVYL